MNNTTFNNRSSNRHSNKNRSNNKNISNRRNNQSTLEEMPPNNIKDYYNELYGEKSEFSNNKSTNKYIDTFDIDSIVNNNSNMNNVNNVNRPNYLNNDIYTFEQNDLGINTNTRNSTSFITIISILILSIIFISLYLFRDKLLSLYNKYFKVEEKNKIKQMNKNKIKQRNENKIKQMNENKIKQIDKNIKKQIKKRKDKNKEKEIEQNKEKGGVNKLINKMKYKDNQISKINGYCFIGNENNERKCSEIYEGNICMSGEIFRSQQLCMFPNLRP